MFNKHRKGIRILSAALAATMLLCFGACSSETSDAPQNSGPETHYDIPAFLDVEYDEGRAYRGQGVIIDASHSRDGYIAVSCVRDKRLKFQVMLGDDTYTYNVSNEGEVTFFPLQCGDGTYTFRVMKNTTENRYAELYKVNHRVTLSSEFRPFLRTSRYAAYTRDSRCVAKARELAESSADANDFIANVFKFITKNIKYDKPKAENIQSGYLPVPDETMSTGKGICFDYASLAAAMLRSQGIPTKVIFGYVSPNDVYHAWNMIYTEESGWITVEISVDEATWNRFDLTFSANGSSNKFIGNGENYSDVYQY